MFKKLKNFTLFMLARLHERQNWRYFSVQFERRKVDIKAN